MVARKRVATRATKRVARKLAFRRWDAADYLKSSADIPAYLNAAMEEAGDDAAYIAAVLGDIAKARGILRVAADAGMTRQGLYRAPSPDGNPSFATILKVTKATGLRLQSKAA